MLVETGRKSNMNKEDMYEVTKAAHKQLNQILDILENKNIDSFDIDTEYKNYDVLIHIKKRK